MQEITLTLSVDEVNLIMAGLGMMSFAKVFALVGKIQSQTTDQLSETPAEATE